MDSYTFQLMDMGHRLLSGTNTQTSFHYFYKLPVCLQFLTCRSNILHIWHLNQHKSFSLINKYCKLEVRLRNIIITHKRSCEKVMLLHLSLSHSVHGAGGLPDRDPPQDRDLPCTVTSGRTVRINAFLLLVCSDVRSIVQFI